MHRVVLNAGLTVFILIMFVGCTPKGYRDALNSAVRMEKQEEYKKAKKRVEEKLGFYIHLAIYSIVNGLIFLENPAAWPGEFWCFWPWTICIVFHGLGIFSKGSSIKKRMIESEMKRDISGHGNLP